MSGVRQVRDSWELCRSVPLNCVVPVTMHEQDADGNWPSFTFVPDSALLRYRWPGNSPWCEVTLYGEATNDDGGNAGRKKKHVSMTYSEWVHALVLHHAPDGWPHGKVGGT